MILLRWFCIALPCADPSALHTVCSQLLPCKDLFESLGLGFTNLIKSAIQCYLLLSSAIQCKRLKSPGITWDHLGPSMPPEHFLVILSLNCSSLSQPDHGGTSLTWPRHATLYCVMPWLPRCRFMIFHVSASTIFPILPEKICSHPNSSHATRADSQHPRLCWGEGANPLQGLWIIPPWSWMIWMVFACL